MSALAAGMDAINLGQGFPDTDGPEAGDRRGAGGDRVRSQPVCAGDRRRVAPGGDQRRTSSASTDSTFDPDREVLVTTGATEAIAATILALCEPGDSVVSFEPYYDSYAASIALAGAEHQGRALAAARLVLRPRAARGGHHRPDAPRVAQLAA